MSSNPPRRKLTLDDLNRALGLDTGSGEDLTQYLDAAAVLAAFDPLQLRPTGGTVAGPGPEPAASVPDALLLRCELITQGPASGLWRLSLPDRRAALRRLATSERMREALSSYPDPPGLTVQQVFGQVLDGDHFVLSDASRAELVALLTVRDWVDGILPGLPEPVAVSRAIAQVDLLAPMRRLADDDFVGRDSELGQLAEYVRSPAPGGLVGRTFRATWSVPLFVYGPGGMGKSTLLARFILDQAGAAGLRAVYLDIDRPTIRPDSPATVLLEIVSQLRPQLDAGSGALDALVQELAYSVGRADAGRFLESGPGYETQLRQFRAALAPLLDSPVLVVIDTFEEAEFLGADVAGPFSQFLLELAKLLPELRLVLSGRTLPAEFVALAFPSLGSELGSVALDEARIAAAVPLPYRPVNLALLGQQSARDLLQRLVTRAGLAALPDRDLDDVIGVVSRNPMCLRLAARILEREGTAQLVASRSTFLTRLRAEKIQALLYGRILSHLHADDVRAVAYPGLVVRRIAPDVIREVLAEPCGLQLTAERDEHAIFEALGKEVALVQADPEDGSLRHRADVRRAMLEDLTDHVPADVVEQIDRRAVRFYRTQPGPIARAEEIYHRLRLREPAVTLDERWLPEARDYLKNAGEEVPSQQQLWLAGKLGVTLGASVRQAASQEAWEEQAARSAERYLQSGEPDPALRVLRERTARQPRSRLYFLEAEALRFLGRPDAALQVARDGATVASKAGAVDLTLELLLQMVVIQETRGDLESAAELAREAGETGSLSGDGVLRLRAAVTQLRIFRRLHPEYVAEADRRRPRLDKHVATQGDTLRQLARARLTGDVLRAIQAQPVLLREAAAELGEDEPQLAAAAVRTLGVEVSSDEQAAAFGGALESLNRAPRPASPLDQKFAEGAEKAQEPRYAAGAVRSWAAKSLTGRDVRDLGAALGSAEPGAEVLRDFGKYFQAGVDSGLTTSSRNTYKWLVLSITTLGTLVATANASIVLISLPAIFRGIKLDPLITANVSYLLWMLLGYLVVPAVLVVTLGPLGNTHGRVQVYNLGFATFGLTAVALALDPFTGPGGALWLIGWRVVQSVGAAMLLANSGTILTDTFPADRRGMALGINSLGAISGSVTGLIVGGVLAAVDWRLVFILPAPIGLFGAVWGYLSLREISIRTRVHIDWLGNATFALGLIGLLIGLTFGVQPYDGHAMGWTSPVVLATLSGGIAMLIAFCFIEQRVYTPLLDLRLLKIRSFGIGSAADLLAAIGRGGSQFMLIIWLEGIWLILHGYALTSIPLWAGIYLLPLSAGFFLGVPLAGYVSDRHGAPLFAFGGLLVSAAGFGGLLVIPTNFSYPAFGVLIFLQGLGAAVFTPPNRATAMNSVPFRNRDAASGLLSTLQNSAFALSTGLLFALVIAGLSTTLPAVMFRGLTDQGVPAPLAHQVAQTPATASLFSAFLGENPVPRLLAPTGILKTLPPHNVAALTSPTFFPDLISGPFHHGLVLAFGLAIGMLVIGATASLLPGPYRVGETPPDDPA